MKGIFEKNKKHIPNILTTLRLGAVPAFWFLTLTGNLLPATILFGSACATDALDGFLARRWKAQSVYGKVTDPLADKMLVMSALLLNGITLNPLMLVPFILESGIAIVNIKDFMKDVELKKIFNKEYIKKLVLDAEKVKVSQTGREKTIALMSTVSLGLLTSGLKLPLEKVVNLLILLTGTMEAATFVEYVDAKIISKDDSHMRLPDFFREEDKKEKIAQNDKNIIDNDLTIEEKIQTLKNDKDLLTNKNNIDSIKEKKKDFKN